LARNSSSVIQNPEKKDWPGLILDLDR